MFWQGPESSFEPLNERPTISGKAPASRSPAPRAVATSGIDPQMVM